MPSLVIENIPPQIHAELQKAAKYNHRSITQQALTFLEQALNDNETFPYSSVEITDFKERLKATREKASLTQPALAEKAEVELSSLEKLENGELYPFKAVGAVAKLARALDVTSLWLVHGDLPTTADPERVALVDSIQGKYAFVNTSSETFAERKRLEYEQDN
jgi:transcriptional regulator with XRE-family HTH domain